MKRIKKENPLLKGIYKASQCTDFNDCIQNIQDCDERIKQLRNVRKESRALYIRKHSLEKKCLKLFEISVHPKSRA